MIKGDLNIWRGLPSSLIDSSNFDCSLVVSIDHFVDNLLGVSHDNYFGDLKLLSQL